MININKMYQVENKTDKEIILRLYGRMVSTTLKPSGTLSTNIVFLKDIFKEYEELFISEDLIINNNIELDELREMK